MSPIPLHKKRELCALTKYVAALIVVNGHLFIFGNPESPLTPFMNLGACCVSIFFFFSGYGLMTSYRHKGELYLQGFFGHRMSKVILPLLTAYIVTLPVYAHLKGSINWQNVLETISWGGPYLRFSWYVTEIVVLYVIFFLVMRPAYPIRTKRILLTMSVLILMVLLIVARQPNWYIISLPGFIVGIWFEEYEDRLSKLLSVNAILIASTAIWFFTWQWNLIGANYLAEYRWVYLSYYIYNIAFVCMVVGVISKINITPPIYI